MPHDEAKPSHIDFMQVNIKVNEDYDEQESYAYAFLSLLTAAVACIKKIDEGDNEAIRALILNFLPYAIARAANWPDKEQGDSKPSLNATPFIE